MNHHDQSLFAISPLFSRILIIAMAIGTYYFITMNDYFPVWNTYIYYAMKIIIAYEIVAGSARTLMAPILSLFAAIALFYLDKQYQFQAITPSDTWQLVIMAIIGFFITLLFRFGQQR